MKTIKFLLFIAIVCFLSGCQVNNYRVYSTFIDYSSYTKKKNFMSESPSANFDYNPVGSVAGVSRTGTVDTFKHKSASVVDALDAVYAEAVKRGANGIINLKYDYVFNTYGGIETVSVKGMAIKRKKIKE